MRLEVLNSGHRLREKIIMKMINLIMGDGPPDVVRLLQYRPKFFGRPFSNLLHVLLRKTRGWDDGRAELFAAFVSAKNQCPY